MLDRLISWIPKPKKSAGSAPSHYDEAARVANSKYFDEAYYLEQALEAGEPIGVYPQLHYVLKGHQRFDPHPGFKSAEYRQKHGLAPETNPLLHYHDHADHADDFVDPGQPAVLLAPQAKQFCFEHGRYLYSLVVPFREAGCRIYLESPSDVTRERERFPFFDSLIKEPWVRILTEGEVAPENVLLLTDNPRRAVKGPSILWRRGKPRTKNPGLAFLNPFPMHARQYQQGFHRHLRWLRCRERTTTLYFSGANTWIYRLPYLRLRFGITGRSRLLDSMRHHFGESIDGSIGKNYRLRERTRADVPIVIADQRFQRSPHVLWLEQLAYADFFLCFPGNYMPSAHNLVETMAVGTIPILAYGHTMHPALEDGVNCLVYDVEASFVDAVERALAMPEEEKARLRAGVIDYYERFLAPAVWAEKLLLASGELKQLYFPYESCLKPGWARTFHH